MSYRALAAWTNGALLLGFALGRWTHAPVWPGFLGMTVGYSIGLAVEIVKNRRV